MTKPSVGDYVRLAIDFKDAPTDPYAPPKLVGRRGELGQITEVKGSPPCICHVKLKGDRRLYNVNSDSLRLLSPLEMLALAASDEEL